MRFSIRTNSSFIFLVATLVTLPLIHACGGSEAAPAPPPPPTVSVVALKPETVPVSSEWVATLDGYVNAQIRPQVCGYLIRRTYREGAMVSKGEVLFEIDPRPFEAALAQVESAARAGPGRNSGRPSATSQRDTPLAKARAIPQSQFDDDVQANLAAQAGGAGGHRRRWQTRAS